MYNLGEHFKPNYTNALVNSDASLKSSNYRITVLTERLVRLEYSADGNFEDRPTTFALNRNFQKPEFGYKEDDKFIEITTKFFRLTYVKDKKFKSNRLAPASHLKIELLGTEKSWYYGHPEVKNYGAPTFHLAKAKGKKHFKKGLYSLDGFASFDDSKTEILLESGELLERDSKDIDIYVFMYHNDYDGALKDYFKLTGKPALIPRYALGNWWTKNDSYDDYLLKELVDTFEDKDIPVSVLTLNSNWHMNRLDKKDDIKSGFTFNENLFKAPGGMINYLHSKGIRVGLTINPEEGFYKYEDNYEKAKEYLSVNDKEVIPFNVMDSKTIDVYLKLFIHPLESLGVDFFWLDAYEKDAKKLEHLKHYQFLDLGRNYDRRPMIISEKMGKVAHRFPVLYSGKTLVSWETLKYIPFHNNSAANIGVSFWAHDIGGYHKGTEDNELFTRFVQLGVFSPILKLGSDEGKYYKREPWKWNIKTYQITKDFLQLRHKLIPYLYSEAYKYHNDGVPLVRPLYYKYPEYYDDLRLRNQYFFGSQLFVSPIITKKDYVMNRVIHKFFIPEGIWYDFFTGKKFPGGKTYVSFYKEEEFPVFAKAGSIIPFGDNGNLNNTTPPKNMEIHIFPGRSNLFDLYEDDGNSDLYRKGFFLKSTIDYNYMPNNYTVIVRAVEGKSGIVPDTRNYKFRFRNTKKANNIVAYFDSKRIGVETYEDENDFIVEVKDVKTTGQLTINCKGKDIEIEATRVINSDIEGIIQDLPIETEMKETIDEIVFGPLEIKKKRIKIRRLRSKKLESKFIKLFLKLLEYVEKV